MVVTAAAAVCARNPEWMLIIITKKDDIKTTMTLDTKNTSLQETGKLMIGEV